VRIEEVAEGVVAGQVPAGAPDLLHARLQQAAGAAHVLVDAAQLERGVVQRRVRAAGDREAVVPAVDPQEVHHRAHLPVHDDGNAKVVAALRPLSPWAPPGMPSPERWPPRRAASPGPGERLK
jgi:hypothetical protein